MPRYPLRIAAAAVTGLAAALALSVPAHASTSIVYAALGDSYSSGVGTNHYDPSSGSCERSPDSYPPLWAAAHTASLTFVACAGATTSDVRANQLGGLTASTTLVTITIGGNDAGFSAVLTTCTLGPDSLCAAAVAVAEAYAQIVLPGALNATYAAIRAHAPNATLVVLGYPRLFELTSSCGLFGLDRTKRTVLNQGADVLDAVIAARAAAAGATYVDARPPFAGHGVCSAHPWINGLTFPIGDSYHPKASGYRYAYLPALTAVTG